MEIADTHVTAAVPAKKPAEPTWPLEDLISDDRSEVVSAAEAAAAVAPLAALAQFKLSDPQKEAVVKNFFDPNLETTFRHQQAVELAFHEKNLKEATASLDKARAAGTQVSGAGEKLAKLTEKFEKASLREYFLKMDELSFKNNLETLCAHAPHILKGRNPDEPPESRLYDYNLHKEGLVLNLFGEFVAARKNFLDSRLYAAEKADKKKAEKALFELEVKLARCGHKFVRELLKHIDRRVAEMEKLERETQKKVEADSEAPGEKKSKGGGGKKKERVVPIDVARAKAQKAVASKLRGILKGPDKKLRASIVKLCAQIEAAEDTPAFRVKKAAPKQPAAAARGVSMGVRGCAVWP